MNAMHLHGKVGFIDENWEPQSIQIFLGRICDHTESQDAFRLL
jgi:hypothetical protein